MIYDWNDAHAVAILRRCAEAAGPDGTVLLFDGLLDRPGNQPPTTGMDLHMLTYVAGRERGGDELGRLAAAAGLMVTLVVHLTRWRSVIALSAARAGGP